MVVKVFRAGKMTKIETARRIVAPPRLTNFLDIDNVVAALNEKDFEIRLTQQEKKMYQEIPFSQEILKMAAERKWRGKRAILWAAPPERFGINMLKIREIFGIDNSLQREIYGFGPDPSIQPCMHNDNGWWLGKDFAKEILRQGYHLTLAELPDETKEKFYNEQKALMTDEEQMVKPVELNFLTLINFMINNGDRILEKGYSRTDRPYRSGAIHLGVFIQSGLYVDGDGSFPMNVDNFGTGLLFSRKFDRKFD